MVFFCSNCGSKLEDGAQFCTSCGKKVDDFYKSDGNPNIGSADANGGSGLMNRISKKSDEMFYDMNVNRNKNQNKELAKMEKEKVKEEISKKRNQDDELLYYVNGREGELFIYEEYIEFDFTGSLLKKALSHMGGIKKLYYYQINGIQKRDAGSTILGSLEFEVPGMSMSRELWGTRTENVLHYSKMYQEEVDRIFDFVNNKILELNKAKMAPSQVINEVSPMAQLKEAKELLDLGIITEDEFQQLKQDLLFNK